MKQFLIKRFLILQGNIGMLSVGQFFGWPTLPKLREDKDADYPVHLTFDEASWIAALLTFGTTFGSVICAFVVRILSVEKTPCCSQLYRQ